MALFTSMILVLLGLWFYLANRDFGSRLSLMLSGAALSTGVTLIIVEWVTEIAGEIKSKSAKRKLDRRMLSY